MAKTVQSETINRLMAKICNAWPPAQWIDAKLIAAVSAGADSVAMLHLLRLVMDQAGGNGNIIAIYCNHQTRTECEDEKAFVSQLAKQLNCEFDSYDFNRIANRGIESEESFRTFRYEAYLKAAHKHGARYVATAHHADDQIETVLFRIFRGTGLSGLAGIPPIRIQNDVSFVRPMLQVRRSELRRLLSEIDQPFCEDPTNAQSHYARNFIRNEMLPTVQKQFGPQSMDSILRLSEQAQQLENFLDVLVESLLVESLEIHNDRAAVSLVRIKQHPPLIITHFVRQIWKKLNLPEQEMNRQRWAQLTDAVTSGRDGRLQLPANTTIEVVGDQMFVKATPRFKRKSDG